MVVVAGLRNEMTSMSSQRSWMSIESKQMASFRPALAMNLSCDIVTAAVLLF